jgi:hypothetical protein
MAPPRRSRARTRLGRRTTTGRHSATPSMRLTPTTLRVTRDEVRVSQTTPTDAARPQSTIGAWVGRRCKGLPNNKQRHRAWLRSVLPETSSDQRPRKSRVLPGRAGALPGALPSRAGALPGALPSRAGALPGALPSRAGALPSRVGIDRDRPLRIEQQLDSTLDSGSRQPSAGARSTNPH